MPKDTTEESENTTTVTWNGQPLSFTAIKNGETVTLDITDPTFKALTIPDGVSLEDYRDMIHASWYKAYEYRGWICNIFDTYVIVHMDKKSWQIPYTIDDDMEVEFAAQNEWVQVKKKSEWVPTMKSHITIDDLAIKSLGENRIGGYGILWGDEKHKDIHDEYFTEKTADMTSVFDALGALPWLFNHTVDKKLKSTVVGVIDKIEVDEVGLWYEAKIREHEIYKKYIRPLVSAKALFSSSGAFPGSKEKNKKTGEITRWTIGEVSGTHTPADFFQMDQPLSEIKSMYQSAGLNPDLLDRQDKTETNDENEQVGESTPTAKGSAKDRLEVEIQLAKSNLRLMELQL